ncbi:hypothetical protein SDRG_08325 [Saprolegnia diclina VS20]|uniref:Tubby C-terminal domain-containing protein n=1 Tax=Saprolegnia diclina (strain VS20) TaxID=1156394 RepID=T0QH97_SAPDV|nr:hypothetical protein SDRG_08325 [Saprolegnia diclina VS20]EQC34116.1 hypothetical protein SDRG_08325 [Saprolegnia diclina VS20]|eukprot:XP_008612428.1 hypothetical protein SDRG_08325 [Saprolegnia diclina VS20]
MLRSNNAAPVLDLPSLKAPERNDLVDVDGWYTDAHELPEASGSDDELDIALVSSRLLPESPSEAPVKQRAYDVHFDAGPLGLELERDWSGELTLVKHIALDGPAQASGLIRIGDVLHAMDHISCLHLSLAETQSRLATPGPHTLHLTSPCSFSDVEREVCIAKQCIHEHKARFYQPLETPSDNGLLLGCIERYRGDDVTSFHLHREDTGEFLLACSCESDLSGPFLFHTLRDTHLRRWKDLPRGEDCAVYMGELVENFLGTEFRVLDHARRELGFFVYESNVLGRCPNSLTLALNREPHGPPPSERYKKQQQERDPSVLDRLRLEVESFVEALTSPRNSKQLSPAYDAVAQDDDDASDLALFQTTKPAWSEAIHAWTLHFDGRVHVPSKKNFLLSALDDANERTVLRFGKVSKVRFTLDFQAPLSPLVALAVAVSAFAKKRIVTS